MITPHHKEFLSQSVALWMGSADLQNIPDSVRCLGGVVEDETTLRCFIAQRFSGKFLENLSVNKHITLASSHPFTFEGYQYKGDVLEVRPCLPDEVEIQKEYMDKFSGDMAMFGLVKERVSDMYYNQPSVAIRIKVKAMFEQTPKQNTGGAI